MKIIIELKDRGNDRLAVLLSAEPGGTDIEREATQEIVKAIREALYAKHSQESPMLEIEGKQGKRRFDSL